MIFTLRIIKKLLNFKDSSPGFMKRIFFSIAIVLCSLSLYAQVPTVTPGNIDVTTGAGVYTPGTTITVQWDNTLTTGDNNLLIPITGVTVDFSQFGGPAALAAINSLNIWTASYVIVAGSVDAANLRVSVTATNSNGSTTTQDDTNISADNESPTVTTGAISITTLGSGAGGVFLVGDPITVQWDDTAVPPGDNNTDVISNVTIDFSDFGGGAAVAAGNIADVWSATYVVVSGSIDATGLNASVTATDNAGNTTTTSGTDNISLDNEPPTVTASNISITSAGSGPGGVFNIDDDITVEWDNTTGSGDNNSDAITGVTVDFSAFGGPAAQAAVNTSDTWSATFTVASGAIDATSLNASVTATDGFGYQTTAAGTDNISVDNIAPSVTAPNISIVSAASGTGGEYIFNDDITVEWNNTGGGENNSDVISAVTIDFSAFGGGAAVTAVNAGDTWSATYPLPSGAIDATSLNANVTVTDNGGNSATAAGTDNVSVDNQLPTVTTGAISITTLGSGAGGVFLVGDPITVQWDDTAVPPGDNNTDVISNVTIDFSDFGGGAAVAAGNIADVWSATYVVVSGSIDATGLNASVTATDNAGNTTTTSGTDNISLDNEPPTVTASNISITSAGSGPGGVFNIDDDITVEWDNTTGSGDNNSDAITGVTVDFSAFGGPAAQAAVNTSDTWSATFTVASGAIDATSLNASVTATDGFGYQTTAAGTDNISVDNIAPSVTAPNISIVSAASGTGGEYIFNDDITVEWNNTGGGENNSDVISAVKIDFSAFGGGAAVTAVNAGDTWSATYPLPSGAIDATSLNAIVTVTDNGGNSATAAGTDNVSVDNQLPTVTAGNISITSPASGNGGVYIAGDDITVRWDNSLLTGDNNPDVITDVTIDFTDFGGGGAVVAINTLDIWEATYNITAGAIDASNLNVSVTATEDVGNAFTRVDDANLSVDNIIPTFVNAHFFDTNLDGDIDQIVIEMSEPVDHTTAELGDFTLTGGSITGVIASGGLNGLDLTDADEFITLTVSLTGTGTANIDYDKAGAGTVQLADLNGNEADNDATITEVDAAAPVIITAITDDNDEDGYIDWIDITMSENVVDGGSTLDGTTISISGGYAGVTTGTGASGDDNLLRVTFTESSTPDTDATPSITLNSGTVFDGAGVPNSIGSNQVFSGTEDGAAPSMISATTFDFDLNGNIDRIDIVMSEPIIDANSTIDAGTFDLAAPYDNNSPTAVTGDFADDEFISIDFSEESSADTDATPDVTLNSGELFDGAAVQNSIGSNQTLTGLTEDGAIPILLFSTTTPGADATGVTANTARSISFSFSEDVTKIGGELAIYDVTDLINPVVSIDISNADVELTGGNDISWTHNELLEKGENYSVALDPGAFQDLTGLSSPELLNAGDEKWQWSMGSSADPSFVYSPQDLSVTVAPYGRLYFYFDEPVRIQNSADGREVEADVLNDFGGTKESDEFKEDVDNDAGGGSGDDVGTIPPFILPKHVLPRETSSNYTKEKIFDIMKMTDFLGGYNGGNGWKSFSGGDANFVYKIIFESDCFEDVNDDDVPGFSIEFRVDATDPDRPDILSLAPVDQVTPVADIDRIDGENTDDLVITFLEDVKPGFGNIRLYANLDPSLDPEDDAIALNIPATSSLVSIIGDVVTIDITGITLSGGVDYYVNIDEGAFTDLAGNTHVGLTGEEAWNFKTAPELQAPDFISLSPADNATGVSIDSDLTIVFDEPVKQGTGGNLYVRLSSNGYVVETIPSSSFTFDGANVDIPLPELGGLSGYYINIENTAIADLGDNAFSGITGSFAWSFTTTSDGVNPSAVSPTFSPAHSSTGASVSTNISFNFDEVVSPITGNNITIYLAGTTDVVEQFDVTSPQILVGGNQVTITPTSDLEFVTEYYIVVDAGAFEDASGNTSPAVGGDGSWNFTTGIDSSNPFIVSTTPVDGASGISSGVITININEEVTKTTGKKIALYDANTDNLIQELDGSDGAVAVATNVATINFSNFTTDGLDYYIAMDKGFFRDLNSNDIEDINPGEYTFSASDNTPPTVVITRNAVTNGSFASTNDNTVSFDLAFSEAVSVAGGAAIQFDIDDVIVSNTGVVIGIPVLNNDGDDRNFTVEIPITSGDGDITISLNSALISSFQDLNGQAYSGTSTTGNIHVDKVDPGLDALTLTSNNASPTTLATTGNTVTLTMDFNDDLNGPPTVTMTSGGDVINNPLVITETNPGAFIWTATYDVSALDSDGAIEFDVTFTDDGENAGVSVDETNIGNTLVIDKVEPTVLTQSASVLGNSITINTSLNETGTVYYMISSTPYTVPATLRSDAISAGNSISIPSASTNYQTIETVPNNTSTTIYLVGEDVHGNLTAAVASTAIQTGGVTVTAPTNLNLSPLCNSSLTPFASLDNIVIDETISNDFRVGAGITFRLMLPPGFEFNTSVGSASATGADVTVQPVIDYPEVDEVRITYTVAATASDDQITISGLEVKATNSPLSALAISRSGGSAVVYGAEESDNQVFGTLSSINPPAPPTLNITFLDLVNGVDDIMVPASVLGTFGASATGSGTINWYNDDFSASITSASATNVPYNTMPDPVIGGAFDVSNADPGLYTIYATDNVLGCESEPVKRNFMITVYDQNPAGFSFVDDVTAVTFNVSEPVNHTVSFVGQGLINESHVKVDTASIQFSPSSVGSGDYSMSIDYKNDNTGEILSLPRDLSVTATADIYATNELVVDYCESDGVLLFDAKVDDLPTGQVFYGFAFDNILIPDPDWVSSQVENDSLGWQINLDTIAPGAHAIQRLIVDETSIDPFNEYIVFLEADLDVYPDPTVEINDLPEFFCEDGLPFSLRATLTSIDFNSIVSGTPFNNQNIANVTSYDIEKISGVGVGATATISTGGTAALFDPTNPIGNGTDPVGVYEISFTSIDSDDPNFPTGIDNKGCISTVVRTIEVLATPDLPEITTNLTGIGGENIAGDIVNLEFCVGDVVPDIVAAVSANDSLVWYKNNSLTTTYNASGTRGNTLVASELFGTNTPNSGFDISIYVTTTEYIDADGMGFVGCESPPKIVRVRVYEDPSLPIVDDSGAAFQLSTTQYLFEYCDTYNGENISFNSTLPGGEAYYKLYNNKKIFQSDWPSNTLNFSDLGFADLPGTDTTIYVSRVLNDSTFIDPVNGQFEGCESSLIELGIRIYETTPAPDTTLFATSRTDYYICSGENLGTITSPGEQATRYAWYEDDGTGSAPNFGLRMPVSAFDDRFIVQNSLSNEFVGFTNINMTTSPITYTYWVTQFQDFNDVTDYIGCESAPSKLTITVYPDPGPPEFSDPVSSNIFRNASDFQFLEASYCQGRITGTEAFVTNGNTDAVFNWYRANPLDSSIVGNAVHTHITSEPVTSSQLKVTDSEQDTIYFVVTQVNNITPNGAEFDGCETEEDEMAFVTLYIYDIPAIPETSDSDYNYCEDAVFANGISLTGEAGVTYRWYTDADNDGNIDATSFFEGQNATALDLDLLNEPGTDSYSYWVTQTQNIGDGVATFEGCESDFRLITVYEVPPEMADINFSTGYLPSSNGFCVDQLAGSINITYTGVPNATFTWYDEALNPITGRINSPELFYNTGVNSVGTYTYYVSQTLNNCESPLHEVTFNIYEVPPTPVFDLAANGTLIGSDYEFIYCRDEDISTETLNITNSQVGNIYEWYFDDQLDEPVTQGIDPISPSVQFTLLGIPGVDGDELVKTPGSFPRYVRSLEDNGCYSNTRRFDLTVGEAPEVAFTWSGLMKDVSTTFTMINENDAVLDTDVQEVRVTIDGSEQYFAMNYNDNDTYSEAFTAPGTYDVELFMRTSEVCRDSLTRTVTILDIIEVPINGLVETFETANHGWFAEYRTLDGKSDTLVSSWELGTPSTATIDNAFSGSNAWVTKLDGNYAEDEISWVYSPAFDITALPIPIVSFYHQHWFFNTRDAVVFQYSLDNGVSWKQLGEVTDLGNGVVESSGRNWYTNDEIPTEPGVYTTNSTTSNISFNESVDTGLFGWAGPQSNANERQSEWLLSINKMVNADTVIFRFALASSGGDEDEGFAFDDFRVYNSDKITLLESFLSASESGVRSAYNDLSDQVSTQSEGSVAWINYFTTLDLSSSSARDDINRANDVDPSARVGYYGIESAPKSVLEGEVRNLPQVDQSTALGIRGFTPSALGVAGLESKKFDITNFAVDPSATNDILRVSATFTATENFSDPKSEFSIRFMVIEKEITGLTIGEFTPNDTIRNVLRKILPNAGGIIKRGAIPQNTSFTETVEWKISNLYDPTKMDVIAIIQNENAINGRREVYQAAILNGDFSNKQLILSVLDQLKDGDPFVIYPNPADEKFNLEILQPKKEAMGWTMYDQAGREVLKGQLKPGTVSTEISTKNLPSGLFLLQLFHKEEVIEPKRILVIHE